MNSDLIGIVGCTYVRPIIADDLTVIHHLFSWIIRINRITELVLGAIQQFKLDGCGLLLSLLMRRLNPDECANITVVVRSPFDFDLTHPSNVTIILIPCKCGT